jgi:(p)ppGpp synthase/HD superfamily hydrolase
VRWWQLGRRWTLKPSDRTCVDVCSANLGADPLNDIARLTEAYRFAADRHVGQRRKGEAAEPYVNHLAEVADLVARATSGADVELVIAAVLHDTVEDTDTTLEELAARFGARVAGLVAEVTDDKTLPWTERKRLQVVTAAHASHGAKVIKLADKTSNLRAMAVSPPRNWSEARRANYLDWSRQVVANCRGANRWLEDLFDEAAAALEERVGIAA